VSTATLERIESIQALENLVESLRSRPRAGTVVSVCLGTGCTAGGAIEVYEAFKNAAEQLGMTDQVEIKGTGCHGFCEHGPLVVVLPEGIFYNGVTAEDAPEILEKTVKSGKLVERLLYGRKKEKIVHEHDLPFYKKQQRLALRLNGRIDPRSIEDYLREGGYLSLAKVLHEYTPERVIGEITRSGLRGRGGGGFPTGRKWHICRQEPGTPKYIICNGDEGDPGAFMDRSIMEANPHAVLEGMIIGAYAIGAQHGFMYVRAEYPLAVRTFQTAISQARDLGLLGEHILGSGLSFDITIERGAGAFVCGEETALIASIEGQRGSPRQKPPYPAQKGLWGRPTNINNVETWATVPLIIEKGPEWFSAIGTETSKGTKVFSLVGKVKNTGLVEVPMGMTLREVIFDIGGGLPKNREFKAVQTGGPSGGCLPAELLDLKVDFEALARAGSIMGSGGMIVMDDRTCMVDVARYFMSFLADESCGKCTPCREGLKQMLSILERICEGQGQERDLEKLQELCAAVRGGSLCGLGGTAPNPVLSTLKHFRHEYEEHIRDKRCRAGICKSLTSFRIDEDKCIACGRCMKACPVEAISGKDKQPEAIDQDKCIRCRACFDDCPVDAICVK